MALKPLDEMSNDELTESTHQYQEAFAEIHDPRDWKAPLNAVIPADKFDLYNDACQFMTATVLEVTEILHYGKMLRVKADGYRAGPAGP